jgi:hypothetical protein
MHFMASVDDPFFSRESNLDSKRSIDFSPANLLMNN